MNKEFLQKEFDRITNRGIIFGLIWIMGIGSVIAIISGYQAGKIFKESGNSLEGKDKIFKKAKVKIEKGKLIVFSDEVKNPVAVRYAFTNTAEATFFNKEGLPASSFRTDDWDY